jgi:hypothetical protein
MVRSVCKAKTNTSSLGFCVDAVIRMELAADEHDVRFRDNGRFSNIRPLKASDRREKGISQRDVAQHDLLFVNSFSASAPRVNSSSRKEIASFVQADYQRKRRKAAIDRLRHISFLSRSSEAESLDIVPEWGSFGENPNRDNLETGSMHQDSLETAKSLENSIDTSPEEEEETEASLVSTLNPKTLLDTGNLDPFGSAALPIDDNMSFFVKFCASHQCYPSALLTQESQI